MRLKNVITFAILSVVAFITGCAKIEYTNILDPKNPLYIGDSLATDWDGNLIADGYENGALDDKDAPILELTGKNPDTIYYDKANPALFNQAIEVLKKQFTVYDISDKTVDASDVEWTVNVNMVSGSRGEIKYNVKDTSQNFTSKTRVVYVFDAPTKDTKPPSISCNPYKAPKDTATIEKGTVIKDFAAYVSVFDYEQGANLKFVLGQNLIMSGAVDVNTPGVYPVVFTATDNDNNSASHTIYFKVTSSGTVINTPPSIEVTYDSHIMSDNDIIRDTLPDVSFDLSLFSYNAYDMQDGQLVDLTADVDVESDVKKNIPGNYTVTFRVSDGQTQVAFTIKVIIVSAGGIPGCDSIPTITLKGNAVCTLLVGSTYVDSGYTAVNQPGNINITNLVTQDPLTINTATPGEVTITYSVTNGCQKTDTKTRKVVIVTPSTNTPPVITLNHSKAQDTVKVGMKYSDYRKTDINNRVNDQEDGVIAWANVTVDTTLFNTSVAGTCSLTYTVTDSKGLTATAGRKIVVLESSGLLETYGVPTSSPLPSVNGTFGTPKVEGEGPNLANIKTLQFDWNLQNQTINYSSVGTSNGQPDWNVVLTPKYEHSFGQPEPKFTLASTGITGLDGEYFIKYDATSGDLIWVESTGKYAIIWSK